MITVREYLVSRFSKSNALTRRESDLIGLKWPLKKGWVEKFADVKITEQKLQQLMAIADSRNSQNIQDRLERKERNRLNKLVKAGAITRADADSEIKIFAQKSPVVIDKKPKTRVSNDSFYLSREWREVRYKALVKHGAACQCCGATRTDGVRLHVDHIKPRSKWPSLQLDINNLQVLCEDCNLGKSNKDDTDWR